MAAVYFVYSAEQFNIRKNVEDKLGRVFVPGKVNINGIHKEYTDILADLSQIRYSDTKVVAVMEKSLAKYTIYN